jgi:hypothetical protein
LNKDIFKEKIGSDFFNIHFGKKYLHKSNFVNDIENTMNITILENLLSKTNIWNNKNFLMMLDQKKLNYIDYSSLNLDVSGNNYRPNVDKVQKLVSKGASIILNDIEKYNSGLLKIATELQKLTNGRCQGNLYFSMASHKAFGPHFDMHDVFAVHFEGEKIWNIYENIEKNPINHGIFNLSLEERTRRAGNLVEQVTLKPGDLLYIPRGQFHDALASKNGAIHIAFGLTYFKPIDLMSSLWEKFILNDFMRSDVKKDSGKEDLKILLTRFSKELNSILNSADTLAVLTNDIKNWPYEIKEYSINEVVFNGVNYDVNQAVKFEKKSDKSYLRSGNDVVEVPYKFSKITEYILETKSVNNKALIRTFKNTPQKIIDECIESLKKMKVLH